MTQRITEESLVGVAYNWIRHGHMNPDFVRCAVAVHVLNKVMGDEWAKTRTGYVARKSDWFYSGGEHTAERLRWQDRLVSMAEMLVSFEDIVGFDTWLNRLKSRPLEGAVGELEAARNLFFNHLNFSFRDSQTGTKGLDYDIDLFLPAGIKVAVEIKVLNSKTPINEKTVVNRLKKAARQVPSDRAAWIFLRLPESVTSDAIAMQTSTSAVQKLFRDYNRVAIVILYGEIWEQVPGRGHVRWLWHTVIENTASRHFDSSMRSLISLDRPAGSPLFVSFARVYDRAMDWFRSTAQVVPDWPIR